MNGSENLETYDGLGLAELVRTRQVTVEEVLEAILARIASSIPR